MCRKNYFSRRSPDAVARVFCPGVDPVQLYISIAGICYFYMSNADTLSTVFATDLRAPKAIRARREHAAEAILGYLRR